MADALASCVSSLRSSNKLLASSISILDSGVNDFPRMVKVLQTTRHFELLPTSTLATAQASLLASITPEIASLLSRVETHLDRLERREQALIARCDLLEGRLSHGEEGGSEAAAGSRGRNRASEGDREALRLKQMRGKKERLAYAVERLVMQAQQKERQLRMSVAGK
ncbi:hypothetical protein MMC07_006533 [Pseudocyphellaria aurata]|nr:hypothetical protein [Pseudocyphellaria aurata]